MGSSAASKEKIQPIVMMMQACLRRSLRSSRRACVMVCQRSTVIAVKVNTDSSLANTCKWHTDTLLYNSNMLEWALSLCDVMNTHREEACSIAAQAHLPVYSIVVVPSTCEHIHGCNDYQVDAHAEVSKGQVAHEESRNSQLIAAAWSQIKKTNK